MFFHVMAARYLYKPFRNSWEAVESGPWTPRMREKVRAMNKEGNEAKHELDQSVNRAIAAAFARSQSTVEPEAPEALHPPLQQSTGDASQETRRPEP